MMMIQEQPPLHIEERLLSFTLYLMVWEEKCYRLAEFFCVSLLTFSEKLVYLKSKKVKDKMEMKGNAYQRQCCKLYFTASQ